MRVTDAHDQNQNIAAYEAEIEAIVARLYSLTDAELQILRGEP